MRRIPRTRKRRPAAGRKGGFRLFLISIIFLPIALILYGSGILNGPPAPVFRLDSAKRALNEAADAGAPVYAPVCYRQAESLTRMGWMEMARQNGRFSLFRDYSRADSLLLRARDLAEEGAQIALDSANFLERRSREECGKLSEDLKTWREALDGSLILFDAERFWSDADIKLKQAKELAAVSEYEESHYAILQGKGALARVGAVLADAAQNEASNLRSWKLWVENAIAISKIDEEYAVIVDKAAHRTYLIYRGKLFKSYRCDLGYNSARPKLFAGDGATPEGVYRIVKVKPGASKYYKALLLDYPNEMDKARFAENKRRGVISRFAGIGRLIEIHGDGGSSSDWTDGCIALVNEDIDELIKYVKVGTPVVIVRRYEGSL